MEGFAEYEIIRRMVRVYRHRDDFYYSLFEVSNTKFEIFSPETMPYPKKDESVMHYRIPDALVIIK